MTAAVFTRDTLMLMRREAWRGPQSVAALLNWTIDRTERVARAHGIFFDGAAPEISPETISPPLVPQSGQVSVAVALAHTIVSPHKARRSPTLSDDGRWIEATPEDRARLVLHEEHRRLSFGERYITLTKGECSIFVAVRAAPLNGHDLADRVGTNVNTIKTRISVLNKKLARLRFSISAGQGCKNAGYRLLREA